MVNILENIKDILKVISWELVAICGLFAFGFISQYHKVARGAATIMLATGLVRKRKLSIDIVEVLKHRKPITYVLAVLMGWRGIHTGFWLFHNGKKDENGRSILQKVSMVLEFTYTVSFKKDNQNLYIKDFQHIYDNLLAKGYHRESADTKIGFIGDALLLHNQRYMYYFLYKHKEKPLFILSLMTRMSLSADEIRVYVHPQLAAIHSIFDNTMSMPFQESINYFKN